MACILHGEENPIVLSRSVHFPYFIIIPSVTRVIESVDHKHEQCCYAPCTALPIWTLGLGTEGLVSKQPLMLNNSSEGDF